jgi:F-type H+-transporting ATPase subunit delta
MLLLGGKDFIGSETVISAAILGRYSKSLAEIAFEENLEQEITGDLQTYAEIFRTVPDLLAAFHSPAVLREAKKNLLSELVLKYPVTPITANFLHILLDHNRFGFFQQIFEGYLKSVDERKGVVSARITAALPLSEKELENINRSLAEITGKSVKLDVQTDPGLIGGLVVQVGSTVYDGSIRTRLSEMRRRLTGR